MQTTYQQQIEAIGRALIEYQHNLEHKNIDHTKDDHWKALNDAYSTVVAINISPNPESVALKAKSDPLI